MKGALFETAMWLGLHSLDQHRSDASMRSRPRHAGGCNRSPRDDVARSAFLLGKNRPRPDRGR